MGGSISKLRGHFITRPAQRFNIETRTEKVLSQDMPMPAPKFKADIESRQSNLEENWKQMDKDIRSKDFTHSERLKDVYVTSEDPEGFDSHINRERKVHPDRPLPTNTRAWQLTRGFGTPQGYKASSGRITLEAAQEMLLDHSTNPQLFNAGALATKYDIKVADAESIIQSLTVFTFIKSKSKAITEDEILRLKDPHVAQDDWVVETGELPPIRDRKVQPTAIEIGLARGDKEKERTLLGVHNQAQPPKLITNQNVRSPKDADTKRIEDK